jgi:hypothetical protein
VPKTIQDLPPVVCASGEGGKYPDLGEWLINLEVEDEALTGHDSDAVSDLRVFGAPMAPSSCWLKGDRVG